MQGKKKIISPEVKKKNSNQQKTAIPALKSKG